MTRITAVPTLIMYCYFPQVWLIFMEKFDYDLWERPSSSCWATEDISGANTLTSSDDHFNLLSVETGESRIEIGSNFRGQTIHFFKWEWVTKQTLHFDRKILIQLIRRAHSWSLLQIYDGISTACSNQGKQIIPQEYRVPTTPWHAVLIQLTRLITFVSELPSRPPIIETETPLKRILDIESMLESKQYSF
jgi:hypothetical protein